MKQLLFFLVLVVSGSVVSAQEKLDISSPIMTKLVFTPPQTLNKLESSHELSLRQIKQRPPRSYSCSCGYTTLEKSIFYNPNHGINLMNSKVDYSSIDLNPYHVINDTDALVALAVGGLNVIYDLFKNDR